MCSRLFKCFLYMMVLPLFMVQSALAESVGALPQRLIVEFSPQAYQQLRDEQSQKDLIFQWQEELGILVIFHRTLLNKYWLLSFTALLDETDEQIIEKIKTLPEVRSVELDALYQIPAPYQPMRVQSLEASQ